MTTYYYHLYVKTSKGVGLIVTDYPMTHRECMTMKSKQTNPNRFYVVPATVKLVDTTVGVFDAEYMLFSAGDLSRLCIRVPFVDSSGALNFFRQPSYKEDNAYVTSAFERGDEFSIREFIQGHKHD